MSIVVLGSHTFTAGPAVSKRMALNFAEIEIPDGPNAVHYMGRQNKEVTFRANEVTKAAITDLYTAYATEADAALSVPDFESGTCRIISLDQKESPGKPIQTYYEVDITVAMVDAAPPAGTPPTSISTVEVTAKFGNLTFPINPQNMSRAYSRAVARKSILGSGQTLESKQVGLVHVTLDGVLAGTGAVQAMNCLETLWYNAEVKTLITPTYYTGEDALLVSLSFDIEQMKYFERRISFTADFVVVPSARYKKPAWQVKIMTGDELYDAVGVMSINVERQYGGQASSLDIELDNRNGQNAYPGLNSGADVLVYLGYYDSNGVAQTRRRIWGRIDTVDYTVSKQGGNTVKIAGRCYMGKLMEGAHLGPLNSGCTFTEIYPDGEDGMMAQILAGTGISTAGLGHPYWPYWIEERPFPQDNLVYHDETKLEAIQMISEIYNMRFYMDSGELAGSPALIWESIPIPGVSPDVTLNTKEWGQDIVSLEARLNGIPVRTKVLVFTEAGGAFAIADTESPVMVPSGNPNPAYAPGSEVKYGRKSEIITENALMSQVYCEVLAYSNLYKTMLPDLEIRMTVIGDENLFPAMMVEFANNYTGLGGTYFLVGIVDNLTADGGYTSQLVLRRYSQVMSPTMLSSLFKDISRSATGISRKAVNPLIGIVQTGGAANAHILVITLGSTGGIVIPPPGTYYPQTPTYSVSAFAEAGKHHYWIVDGATAKQLGLSPGSTFTEVNPLTLNMDSDHWITCYFMAADPCALVLTCGAGGSVSPVAAMYVFAIGTPQTVTATANSGYYLKTWFLDGVDMHDANLTYTVTMNANHTLEARFAPVQSFYSLTVQNATGGHVINVLGQTVSGTSIAVSVDGSVTVYPVADSGYSFVRWTFEDGSTSTGSPGGALTILMSKNRTVTPTFMHT